jgi:DNA repair exonuclease SbcCD ATPase subunit
MMQERNAGGLPMSIENRRQLENTRTKLHELEQQLAKTDQATPTDKHVRELTLRSLKKRMNQLTEEIARFEARVSRVTGKG